MRNIDEALATLERSFGPPRKLVSKVDLDIEYRTEDLAGLVVFIANHMLGIKRPKIRLGLVKRGGPKRAPAWIEIPEPCPIYGTANFNSLTLTVCFRKHFVLDAPLATLVSSIAHEMAHVVLNSTSHMRRKDEKFVDLTAMHFGFAEMFSQGKVYSNATDGELANLLTLGDMYGMSSDTKSLLGELALDNQILGYLSMAEVRYACTALGTARSK